MDKYTKFVLSVIAICLVAIVVKLWDPRLAHSTYGDWLDLRKLEGADRGKEKERVIRAMPFVRVFDVYGTVDVLVENTIDVSGSTVDVSGSTVDVSGSDVSIENTVDVSGSIDCY